MGWIELLEEFEFVEGVGCSGIWGYMEIFECWGDNFGKVMEIWEVGEILFLGVFGSSCSCYLFFCLCVMLRL